MQVPIVVALCPLSSPPSTTLTKIVLPPVLGKETASAPHRQPAVVRDDDPAAGPSGGGLGAEHAQVVRADVGDVSHGGRTHRAVLAGEQEPGVDRGPVGHGLVGGQRTVRLQARLAAQHFLHLQHAGRAANQQQPRHVAPRQVGLLEQLAERESGALQQVGRHRLKLFAR